MIIVNLFVFIHQLWGKLFDWWFADPGWFNHGLPVLIGSLFVMFGIWTWQYRRELLKGGFEASADLGDVTLSLPGILMTYLFFTTVIVACWPFVLWGLIFSTLVFGPFILVYKGLMYFARREAMVSDITGRLEGK